MKSNHGTVSTLEAWHLNPSASRILLIPLPILLVHQTWMHQWTGLIFSIFEFAKEMSEFCH